MRPRKQVLLGIATGFGLAIAITLLAGFFQGGFFCPNDAPCTVTGLWNFTGGLEVNGAALESNNYYIDVQNYGAKPDGQVGVGNVLTGALSTVVLTTGTVSATNDPGKTLAIAQYPVIAPPLPIAIATTACGGTGTLGNATYDLEAHYILTETNANGEGAPSLEGAVLLPAGSTAQCLQIASPAAINSSTLWKIYASIDPPFNPSSAQTTWPGVTSGLEEFQSSQAHCSNGSVAIGTACELDSVTTGTAHPPTPNVLITTISTVSVSGNSFTLAHALSNPVNGNQVFWYTPNDTVVANAQAALSSTRGGTLFFPAPGAGATQGCYGFTTGIVAVGLPYLELKGAGPASGYLQSFSNVSAGLPYTPSGTSELCTAANIAVASMSSSTAPHQLHAGWTIDGLAFTDTSGVGNAKGAIYTEDVNHFTLINSSAAFFTGRPSGTGSYYAGTNTGGYAFECNPDSAQSFCQFGYIANFRGLYVNTGIEWESPGRSSEDKIIDSELISSSTGGGAAFYFPCNGGTTGGGNDHIYASTSNYFPVAYYLCDRNADVVISRAENTYSPTYNIMGHTTTGTAMTIFGSGAAGTSCQTGILANGATESGTTVTLNINSLNVPSCIVVGTNLSVSNIAVPGYDGIWPVTAVSNGTGCSGTCGQIQYSVLQTGLGTSGPGTALAANTCQRNNVSGTMINFHDALVINGNCDSTMYQTLNLGGDSPRNEIFDEGTDSQAITNLGSSVQATMPGTPALAAGVGANATAQGGMTTDIFQVCATGAPPCPGSSALHVDPAGNADAPSIVGTVFQQGAIANDVSTGTFLGLLTSLTSAGNAIITPSSATSGVVGVCAAGCGLSGDPNLALPGSVTALVLDGAGTSGDYASVSSTENGAGTDAGSGAPSHYVGRILATAGLGSPPTLNGGAAIAGTSSLPSGNYYVSATCVNVAGGQSKMQTSDTLVTLGASNTYDLQIAAPTCSGSADVGWLPYATHAGQSSGSETEQLATSPDCHTVAISGGTACALTSNWAAGGLQSGASPPGTSTDGPLVKFLVLISGD
jgi:hypothetical protein